MVPLFTGGCQAEEQEVVWIGAQESTREKSEIGESLVRM